ncbi:hypothetical protein GGS26DRAFT_572067 [Hypomontagnella submonticulosa]|nr:hypothetical protein GGS26DRAFT_572067 [Hypomontagnella submonticulosa]
MAPSTKADITEKEAQVLATAWQCFKTQPEVDFHKLAGLTGYTNHKSVQNVLTSVRKKIQAAMEADGEAPATPAKKTKAKATPRSSAKRKAVDGSDDDSSGPATPTPAKRARGKKSAALSGAVVKGEDSDGENNGAQEDNGVPVKQEHGDDDDDIVD